MSQWCREGGALRTRTSKEYKLVSIFWREVNKKEIALVLALSEDECEIAHLYYRTLDNRWMGIFADHETEPTEDLQEAKRDLLGLTRQTAQVIHDRVKWSQTILGNE